jgi:hypothetical protein
MQQEADYLALLEEAASYQIKDRELRLLTAQQQLLLAYTMISEISATPETSPATSTQPASLSVESFKNMDFRSGFTASGRAPLVNGEYREAGASGSASETVVRLADPIVFGELPDARLAAAMPLTTNTGGSGTFYELALVVDLNGAPLNIASTFLGDRIKINSIKFENGQVVLDLIKQGPDDPMCCPTLHVMQNFALEGSDLVLISSEEIK